MKILLIVLKHNVDGLYYMFSVQETRSPYAQSFLNFLGQCRRWSRRLVDEELSSVGHTLSLGVLK
jgi:hypothetical protein